MIQTHCDYNFGDSLVHLNYLRKLAVLYPEKQFVHAAKAALLPQLREVVQDIPAISLIDLSQKQPESINIWKNRNGDFFKHQKRYDWAGFYLEFFDILSRDLGVENPIKQPEDFLFDYPGITAKKYPPIDFLIINSQPFSGQFVNFWGEQFDWLIGKLREKKYSVVTTAPCSHPVPCTQGHAPPMSISDIGSLSLHCKYIFGVATGPIWPTFNVWNLETVKLRLLLLDGERIEIAPNTYHAESVGDGIKILKQHGVM
ncbi:MAG: hypothetical protein KGJ13_08380 [Patescibacteria group bacterium]|nr:hypothetical protein [Patescibacteria group bacterium]